MAIHPKAAKAYAFGLHQCGRARAWTEDDRRLFEAIGRRLEDALSSRLAHLELREHESQLSTLFRTVPDVVWVKDIERALHALQSAVRAPVRRRRSGKSSARPTTILRRARWRTATAPATDGRSRPARSSRRNSRRLRPTADACLFEVLKAPLRDETGKTIGVVGIARDVSERRKSDEQLRVAATAFEAQEGIVILDADKRILRVNHAFVEMTGHVAEDVVGKTPQQIARDPRADQLLSDIAERVERDGFWRGEYAGATQLGRSLPRLDDGRHGARRARRDDALCRDDDRRHRSQTRRKGDRQPRLLRPADRSAEPPPAPRPPRAGARRQRPQRPPRRAAVHRSRQLQAGQRDERPRSRRPAADRGRAAPRSCRRRRRRRGASRRRRVRGAGRGLEREPARSRGAGEEDRRDDSRRAQRALCADRRRPPFQPQHRRRHVQRRRRHLRGAAQASRHRHVRGEGGGTQRAALLRPRHAGDARRPRRSGGGAAPRHSRAAFRAALPAASRLRRRMDRRRGAAALGASRTRARRAGRVHPARRGNRPHPADRPLGAGNRLPAAQGLGRRPPQPRPAPVGQRQRPPIRPARLRRAGRRDVARRPARRPNASCSSSPRASCSTMSPARRTR